MYVCLTLSDFIILFSPICFNFVFVLTIIPEVITNDRFTGYKSETERAQTVWIFHRLLQM